MCCGMPIFTGPHVHGIRSGAQNEGLSPNSSRRKAEAQNAEQGYKKENPFYGTPLFYSTLEKDTPAKSAVATSGIHPNDDNTGHNHYYKAADAVVHPCSASSSSEDIENSQRFPWFK